MFGRKTGFLAAMTMALMLFGGCGTNGTLTESQKREVTDWYNNNMVNGDGTTTSGGDGYWDGYGVNNGNATNDRNNTERNTYGMRTDGTTGTGTTLGQDIRNAWDNVTDTVTGNNNAGGNNTGNGNNR